MGATRFIANAFVFLNNVVFGLFLGAAVLTAVLAAGNSYDPITGQFLRGALQAGGHIGLLVSLAGVLVCGTVALLGSILHTLERIELRNSDEVYVPLGSMTERKDPLVGKGER